MESNGLLGSSKHSVCVPYNHDSMKSGHLTNKDTFFKFCPKGVQNGEAYNHVSVMYISVCMLTLLAREVYIILS